MKTCILSYSHSVSQAHRHDLKRRVRRKQILPLPLHIGMCDKVHMHTPPCDTVLPRRIQMNNPQHTRLTPPIRTRNKRPSHNTGKSRSQKTGHPVFFSRFVEFSMLIRETASTVYDSSRWEPDHGFIRAPGDQQRVDGTHYYCDECRRSWVVASQEVVDDV